MSKGDSMKSALHQPRNEDLLWKPQLHEATIHNQVNTPNRLIYYEHQWLHANRKGDRIKHDQITPLFSVRRLNHHNSSNKVLHFT